MKKSLVSKIMAVMMAGVMALAVVPVFSGSLNAGDGYDVAVPFGIGRPPGGGCDEVD